MLKPKILLEIREEIKQTAKAAFSNGSLYIILRDEIRSLFEDEEFIELCPSLGQPSENPARPALIIVT